MQIQRAALRDGEPPAKLMTFRSYESHPKPALNTKCRGAVTDIVGAAYPGLPFNFMAYADACKITQCGAGEGAEEGVSLDDQDDTAAMLAFDGVTSHTQETWVDTSVDGVVTLRVLGTDEAVLEISLKVPSAPGETAAYEVTQFLPIDQDEDVVGGDCVGLDAFMVGDGTGIVVGLRVGRCEGSGDGSRANVKGEVGPGASTTGPTAFTV